MKIIIRVDDVDPEVFIELTDWFKKNFPSVPINCFLTNTAYRGWNKKTWLIAKEMITNYGWEIGGHSRTHPYLTSLSIPQVRNEILGNIMDIKNGLKQVGLEYEVYSFAYPYGDFDDKVKDILREQKISVGATYPDGFPYNALLKINDPLEVGITSNDKLPLVVLNNRFDTARSASNIYCLCLHTNWCPYLTKNVFNFMFSNVFSKEIPHIIKRLMYNHYHLDKLASHLNHIKKSDDIKFLTFRELLLTE
jgi:peptidoglycan/xylan/chitin deacetylase (PgdA/CDA1 family)